MKVIKPCCIEILKYSINIFFIAIVFSSCNKSSKEVIEEPEVSTILMATYSRPLTDRTYESSPKRIARGKYLTEGLWCMTCHTERDSTKAGWPPIEEKKFSGALRFKTDSTWLYAPNLTPDKETGAGNLTDDMLARAIREGVGHDGRSLLGPAQGGMPWPAFRNLTDEDLASIIIYLKTIPAIKNKIPSRKIGTMREENLVNSAYPITVSIPEPDFNDPVSKGKYLIELTECVGCHTGWYARNPGIFGGGNPMGHNKEHIFSPNISSDETGIGSWSEKTFISVMRNGKGGLLSPMMPWVSFRNMTDEDLGAIYMALKTTYPVKHIVFNGAPPTYCEVCELEHGLGDQNHIVSLQPFDENFEIPFDLAGIYCNQNFDRDTLKIVYDEGKLRVDEFELVPVSESMFVADGYWTPIDFIRNQEGKVTGLHTQGSGLSTFKKVE